MKALIVIALLLPLTGCHLFKKPSDASTSKAQQDWPGFLTDFQTALRHQDQSRLIAMFKFGVMIESDSEQDFDAHAFMGPQLKAHVLGLKPQDVAIVSTAERLDPNATEERHIQLDTSPPDCAQDPDCAGSAVYLYIGKYAEGYRVFGKLAAG